MPENFKPVLLSNPCFVNLNDIRIAISNTNVVKDIVSSITTKNEDKSNIDLTLRSIIE